MKTAALSILFSMLSDTPVTEGTLHLLAQFTLLAVVIFSFCLPPQACMLLVLTVLLSGRTIDASDHIADLTTASLWQIRIGSLSPSTLVTILLVLLAVKVGRRRAIRVWDGALGYLVFAPIALGWYRGNFSDSAAIAYAVTDCRFPVMLWLALSLTTSFLGRIRNGDAVLLAILAGSGIGRHSVDLAQSFVESGVSFGIGNVVSVCATKGLVVLLLYICLGCMAWTCMRGLAVIGTMSAAYLIAVYSTRTLYVTTLAGFPLFLATLPRKKILSATFGVVVTTASALCILQALRPDTAAGAYSRFLYLINGRDTLRGVSVDYNVISRVDPTRYAELINIFYEGWESGSFILGTGAGGSFSDYHARLPTKDLAAFPLEQSETGRFFYAHDLQTHLLLKMGIVGLLIVFCLWFTAGRRIFCLLAAHKTNAGGTTAAENILYTALLAFIPTAAQSLWWSGKGVLIWGIVLACAFELRNRAASA